MSRKQPFPRTDPHGQGQEPLLEGFLAKLRYRESLRLLRALNPTGREIQGLDLGCGYQGVFVEIADRLEGVRFRGGDLSVDPSNPRLFPFRFEDPPELEVAPDFITMHAVLEHLDDDVAGIRWVYESLAPGGVCVATVPSVWSKPILEFLAFGLKLVSRAEIEDHKRYYRRSSLETLFCLPTGPFSSFKHRYFQVGMNNLVIARKST